MVAVVLQQTDLALWSDLTKRCRLRHLVSVAPQVSRPMALVRFSGDTAPTSFRGTGRDRSWELTVRFGSTEQDELLALESLLDAAAEAPDSRLLLRTHWHRVAGLNPAALVVASEPVPTPARGGVVDAVFTVTEVSGFVGWGG